MWCEDVLVLDFTLQVRHKNHDFLRGLNNVVQRFTASYVVTSHHLIAAWACRIQGEICAIDQMGFLAFNFKLQVRDKNLDFSYGLAMLSRAARFLTWSPVIIILLPGSKVTSKYNKKKSI